jgi:predicted amidohydrolase
MQDITLAAISMRSRPAEPEANLKMHAEWVRKAKAAGAELCCFPEMSVTGFCFDYREFFRASEPVEGSSAREMTKLARESGMTIGFGLATRNPQDLVCNSYVVVSPQGFLGYYAKTHIPILEYPLETPGNEFTVVDVGQARVGVNICFDNWFSEAGRLSYLNGAEILLAPFYMSWGKETIRTDPRKASAFWKKPAFINFPAAAWQNGVYHVAINSCGGVHEKGTDYDGPPLILIHNPLGELEVESDPGAIDELMIVHTLRAETLWQRRSEELFHPKYRRPEIYGRLTEPLNKR